MAWNKTKSKLPPLSAAEREYVRMKLEATKKLHKPLKGQFIFKRDDLSQEVVETARYYKEEDIKADAEATVARINKHDSTHHWSLISWKLVGKEEVVDDETDENHG